MWYFPKLKPYSFAYSLCLTSFFIKNLSSDHFYSWPCSHSCYPVLEVINAPCSNTLNLNFTVEDGDTFLTSVSASFNLREQFRPPKVLLSCVLTTLHIPFQMKCLVNLKVSQESKWDLHWVWKKVKSHSLCELAIWILAVYKYWSWPRCPLVC